MGANAVVVADVLSPEIRAMWRKQAPEGFALSFLESSEAGAEALKGARVLVTKRHPIGPDLLSQAPQLQLVQQVGRFPTGIDLEACAARGVRIAVWPLISRITVAEHAMALMLAVARNLGEGERLIRAAAYRDKGIEPVVTDEYRIAWNWMDLTIRELYGRVLGLVGAGEIALEVTTRARAFGMRVLYYNRRRLPARWEERLGLAYRDLDGLLAEGDYVSLHLPHTPETTGLIGRRELSLMKAGAALINTARGGLVDEGALAEALESGRLAAGLDVFVEEPLPHHSPLLRLPNVFLAPHIGGGQAGGLPADLRRMFADLEKVLSGAEPSGNWRFDQQC